MTCHSRRSDGTAYWLVIVATMLALGAPAAHGQGGRAIGVIDDAALNRTAALSEFGRRIGKPAQYALDHRADLELTPSQVDKLNVLVVAQNDSASVRMQRTMSAAMARVRAGRPRADYLAWDGPVDESAIRAQALEQLDMMAEQLVNAKRDRVAAGAVLSATQRAKIQQIEREERQRISRSR